MRMFFVVLDVKLEMTVVRFENGVPHVQLNYNGRNLNTVIRALLPESTSTTNSTVIPMN